MPVTARSNAYNCGRSLAGTANSNPDVAFIRLKFIKLLVLTNLPKSHDQTVR